MYAHAFIFPEWKNWSDDKMVSFGKYGVYLIFLIEKIQAVFVRATIPTG